MSIGLPRTIDRELRTPVGTLFWLTIGVGLLILAWGDPLGLRPVPESDVLALAITGRPTGGFEVVDLASDRLDGEVRAAVIGDANAIGTLEYRRHDPAGLVVPTRLVDRVRVRIESLGMAEITPDTREALRALVLRHATEGNWEGLGAAPITPDGRAGWRGWWPGYAFAVLLAGLAAGLARSLAWKRRRRA